MENELQASILRFIAAARATKAAASSVHVTWLTLTSTSGLLHVHPLVTVDDITKPWYSKCAHDPDPQSEMDPVPESKLLLGVLNGEGPGLLLSILNFPPFLVLSVEFVRVMGLMPSGKCSKR